MFGLYQYCEVSFTNSALLAVGSSSNRKLIISGMNFGSAWLPFAKWVECLDSFTGNEGVTARVFGSFPLCFLMNPISNKSTRKIILPLNVEYYKEKPSLAHLYGSLAPSQWPFQEWTRIVD